MWREWKGRKYKDRFSNGRESASIHLYILSAKKESLQIVPAFDKLRQRLDLLYPGGYQLKSGYNDGMLCTISLMLEL